MYSNHIKKGANKYMPFKSNSNGTKTWTNSSGTYSHTRDRSGHLVSVTTKNSGYTKTTSYSNGKAKSTKTTYSSNGRSIIRKK